jgi:ketosteroid isomerase-like protein
MHHHGAMVRDDQFAKDAVTALDAVWGGGDVAAILECFEPDLVFFGSGGGEEAIGYDGLKAMLETLAPHAEGGTFTIEWDSLAGERLGDVGVISGVGRVRSSGSLERFDGTAYRLSGVLVHRGGNWRWKVYHGSEPASWE